MSSLADALEAYAHAIAVGAPWRVQAERFVYLTSAHRARMVELHDAESAVIAKRNELFTHNDLDRRGRYERHVDRPSNGGSTMKHVQAAGYWIGAGIFLGCLVIARAIG